MKKIYTFLAILILFSCISYPQKVTASIKSLDESDRKEERINGTNMDSDKDTNLDSEYESSDFDPDSNKTYRINALEEIKVHETKTIRIYEPPKTIESPCKETLSSPKTHSDTIDSIKPGIGFNRQLFIPVMLLASVIGLFLFLSFACVSVYIKKDGKLHFHVFSIIRRMGYGYVLKIALKENFTNAKEEYELHFPVLFAALHRYEPVSIIAGCEKKNFYIERKLFFSTGISIQNKGYWD